MGESTQAPARIVGRYALYGEIASGGMATVHYGRLVGPVGFSRTVAIKRLHPQFAKDPEFVAMFLDEARLAARIRHPNVVPTLDVVATEGELFLVMEYVQGESLSRLARLMRERSTRIPPRIVASIMSGVLHGLHAAHEARDEHGEPLGIVHRDVSPHNVLVGSDGVARVLDFGVAKAAGRTQTTREGQLKGKLSYMAPEQMSGEVTRQTDVYAAAIVLWEALTGDRLFSADNQAAVMAKVMSGSVEPPSEHMVDEEQTLDVETTRGLRALDAVVLRGLARDPSQRYPSAREMAVALERCIGLASPFEVGQWVELAAIDVLARRATKIAEIESSSSAGTVPLGRDVESGERGTNDRHDEAASQRSSISVSRTGDALVAAPPRKRVGLVVAASLLLVGAVITVIIIVVVASKDGAPRAAASTDTASAPPESASTPAPTTTAAASASAQNDEDAAAPVAAPAASTVPSASARASASPMKQTPRPPPPAPPPTLSTAKKPSCDPPYTIDSAGRKHYRTECL